MGQQINYKLQMNGGADNNDCLIIAIGKALQPDADDNTAKHRGWSAIEQGVNSMTVDTLQTLHIALKATYENQVDYNLPEEPPENENELKRQCQSFIAQLKSTENVKKGIELLACLSDELKNQHKLHVIDKDRLEKNAGSLYAEFKESVSQNRVLPQYIVSNGGHFSNVIPEKEAINFDREIDIKDGFIKMMSTQMSEATSFEHPKYLEKLSSEYSDIPNSYDSDMLNNDVVNHIRSQTKNIIDGININRRDNEKLHNQLDNRKLFEQNRSDSFKSIQQVYSLVNDLPSQSLNSVSTSINELKAAQIQLDEELAWKMQYEEFSEFNQKNPEKVISLEQKEPMAIFMEQYLENQKNKPLENDLLKKFLLGDYVNSDIQDQKLRNVILGKSESLSLSDDNTNQKNHTYFVELLQKIRTKIIADETYNNQNKKQNKNEIRAAQSQVKLHKGDSISSKITNLNSDNNLDKKVELKETLANDFKSSLQRNEGNSNVWYHSAIYGDLKLWKTPYLKSSIAVPYQARDNKQDKANDNYKELFEILKKESSNQNPKIVLFQTLVHQGLNSEGQMINVKDEAIINLSKENRDIFFLKTNHSLSMGFIGKLNNFFANSWIMGKGKSYRQEIVRELRERLKPEPGCLVEDALTKYEEAMNKTIPGRRDMLSRAAYELIAVNHSNGLTHSSCKSGKDREGILSIFADSLLIYRQDNHEFPNLSENQAQEKFSKIFERLFYSEHIMKVANLNAPGAYGIKSIENILPSFLYRHLKQVNPVMLKVFEQASKLNKNISLPEEIKNRKTDTKNDLTIFKDQPLRDPAESLLHKSGFVD